MRENEALDFYSSEVWLFERLWDFQNNHNEKKGKANEIVDFFCRAIFLVEYQKWSWIAFVLLTTLCGRSEKIRSIISTNQMWHENQLTFSRASVRLPVSEPVLWLVVVILRSFENLLWMR